MGCGLWIVDMYIYVVNLCSFLVVVIFMFKDSFVGKGRCRIYMSVTSSLLFRTCFAPNQYNTLQFQ